MLISANQSSARISTNQEPGIRAWLQGFPLLFKAHPEPPEPSVIIVPWPCEHVLLILKIKPVMWRYDNSKLSHYFGCPEPCDYFRGDLRGSTARIEIAVSSPVVKNRRSLVIMILSGNILSHGKYRHWFPM